MKFTTSLFINELNNRCSKKQRSYGLNALFSDLSVLPENGFTAYFVHSPSASATHPRENKSFKKDFYKSTSIEGVNGY